MIEDTATASDSVSMSMQAPASLMDQGRVLGHFAFEIFDERGKQIGNFEFDNLVTTVGKNALENIGLAASGTAGNAFMGLISSTSFSTIVATDTMTSHAGWLEAGSANTPHYTGSRPTMSFGAASGGVIISTGNTFVASGSGTVQGGFVDFSTGATGTIDNTGGVLFSAGTLAVAQPVISGNTIVASYTLTLT